MGLLFASVICAYADDFSIGQPLKGDDYNKQFVVDLGLGLSVKPAYPGANRYSVTPYLIAPVGRYYVPGFGQLREDRSEGLYIFPSVSAVSARKPTDIPRLQGTKTVDWAAELGLGVGYSLDEVNAFVQARRGFFGHTGWVGRLGVDYTYWFNEGLALRFGPRLNLADNSYMDTYFSVGEQEAASGPLPEFDAGAGVVSAGLFTTVSYGLTKKTRLHVQAGWDRYVGDAARSPITKGNDVFSISTGLSYHFSFDFFEN